MVEEVDGYSVPQTPITPGAASLCSFTSSRSGLNRLPRRRKRESVAKMSFRAAAALVKGRSIRESTLRRAQRRSFTPASFMEDIVDFPDELDTSFFARVRKKISTSFLSNTTLEQPISNTQKDPSRTFFSKPRTFLLRLCRPLLHSPVSSLCFPSQDILMHEELSTYADEVFESPSESALKEVESSGKKDETELTGSALDKTELERSHLML